MSTEMWEERVRRAIREHEAAQRGEEDLSCLRMLGDEIYAAIRRNPVEGIDIHLAVGRLAKAGVESMRPESVDLYKLMGQLRLLLSYFPSLDGLLLQVGRLR